MRNKQDRYMVHMCAAPLSNWMIQWEHIIEMNIEWTYEETVPWDIRNKSLYTNRGLCNSCYRYITNRLVAMKIIEVKILLSRAHWSLSKQMGGKKQVGRSSPHQTGSCCSYLYIFSNAILCMIKLITHLPTVSHISVTVFFSIKNRTMLLFGYIYQGWWVQTYGHMVKLKILVLSSVAFLQKKTTFTQK